MERERESSHHSKRRLCRERERERESERERERQTGERRISSDRGNAKSTDQAPARSKPPPPPTRAHTPIRPPPTRPDPRRNPGPKPEHRAAAGFSSPRGPRSRFVSPVIAPRSDATAALLLLNPRRRLPGSSSRINLRTPFCGQRGSTAHWMIRNLGFPVLAVGWRGLI